MTSSSLGAQGREEVPVRGGLHGLQVQAQADSGGTYKIVCTLHHDMRMTVRVRR